MIVVVSVLVMGIMYDSYQITQQNKQDPSY